MSRIEGHPMVPTALLLGILAILTCASSSVQILSSVQIDANNVTCVWVETAASVATVTTTPSPGGSAASSTTSTSVSDANDTVANETTGGSIAITAITTVSTTSTTTIAASTASTTIPTVTTVAAVVSVNDTDDNSTGRRLEEAMPTHRRSLLSRNLQASGYWNCTVDEDDSSQTAEETTTSVPAMKNTTLQPSNSTKTPQNATSNTSLKANSSSGNSSKTRLNTSSANSSATSNGAVDAAEGNSDKSGCTSALFCNGHGTADGSSSSQCSCVCEANWNGERCSLFIDDAPSTASDEAYEGGFKTTVVLICGGGGIALVCCLGIVWTRLGKKEKMSVMPVSSEDIAVENKKPKCRCLKKKDGDAAGGGMGTSLAEKLRQKKELAARATIYLKKGKGKDGDKAEAPNGESSKPDGDAPKAAAEGEALPSAQGEAPAAAEGDASKPKESDAPAAAGDLKDASQGSDAPKPDDPKATEGAKEEDTGAEKAKELD